ncbi:rRNA maturation RNase YbeY [Kiloniella sp. GXU_MW_B19]|uniref:rRNA maturation RNase YbeY n=1 Tax=Kiloniella sp. GXU_MW_B19 TaxID=3141326 RepID=UPI003F9FD540
MIAEMESPLEEQETTGSLLGLQLYSSVEDELWLDVLPDAKALIHRAVVLAYAMGLSPAVGPDAGLLCSVAELSVALSSDDKVRVLNRDHRQKDKPTNVLSFAMLDDPDEAVRAEQTGYLSLGDIVLARETLQREAAEQGKSLEAHFLHLLVHGTLHLLGYDHISDEEAEEMEQLEVLILARLGVANPYAEGSEWLMDEAQ